MTQPKIDTINRGGSRFYIHPRDPARRVPSVTSVVGMLPKQHLKFWAAKVVAEEAVEHIGTVVQMLLQGQRAGAVDFLKRAPTRDTEKASDVGTDVHGLLELLARGEPVGAVHPDLKPYVDGWRAFAADFRPEYLYVEETVWSDTYGYAGSFDAIVRIGDDVVILDNKTTRSGVHADVALQLTAYQHADYIIRPDGTQLPIPEVTGAAVLHLRPERTELVPVHTSGELFGVFRALLEVHRWDRDTSRGVIGKPIGSWAV